MNPFSKLPIHVFGHLLSMLLWPNPRVSDPLPNVPRTMGRHGGTQALQSFRMACAAFAAKLQLEYHVCPPEGHPTAPTTRIFLLAHDRLVNLILAEGDFRRLLALRIAIVYQYVQKRAHQQLLQQQALATTDHA